MHQGWSVTELQRIINLCLFIKIYIILNTGLVQIVQLCIFFSFISITWQIIIILLLNEIHFYMISILQVLNKKMDNIISQTLDKKKK